MELTGGSRPAERAELPSEWEQASIGRAAANTANAIVGGPFGSDLVSTDYVPSGVPVVRGQNMGARVVSGEFVYVSPAKAKALSSNLARPGDLVFTQRGTLGQVAIVPSGEFSHYVVSQSQMKVSLDRERHDPSFVYHYFASRVGQAQIVASAIQTGVPHTNLGILKSYRFPAPPLEEQRTIAAALNNADALLDGLQSLVAKKRALKQAAIQQLLTGKTRLPGFRSDWGSVRIGDVAECTSGGTPSTRIRGYWNGSVRWMSSGELHLKRVKEVAGRITELGLKSSSAVMLPPRCVLIGLAGQGRTRGTVAINEVELCTNQSIAAVLPSPAFDPEYLYHNLDSRYEELRDMSTGAGGRGALNITIVKSVEVALPSAHEQTAIATVLSEMDAEIAALEARLEKTKALKQAMMQELLTGRTRLVALEPVHV